MARYSKTRKAENLTARVCRVLEKLENISGVEIKAFGVRKGTRRVEMPNRWKSSHLELIVHDERAQCIVVETSKPGAIQRILRKRLAEQKVPLAA